MLFVFILSLYLDIKLSPHKWFVIEIAIVPLCLTLCKAKRIFTYEDVCYHMDYNFQDDAAMCW